MFNKKHPYYKQFRELLKPFLIENPTAKVMLFGSSQMQEKFNDIDLGLDGLFHPDSYTELIERFEESTFPYIIDVRDLNEANEEFKQNILSQPILWIQR
jgi:hypothetical protein